MQNEFLPSETAAPVTSGVAPDLTPATPETTETAREAQAVTQLLAQTKRQIRRSNYKAWVSFALLYLTLPFSDFWERRLIDALNFHPTPLSLLFLFLPLAVGMGFVYETFFMPTYLDMEALTGIGGTKAIPLLLESLYWSVSLRHRKAAWNALTILLPQLQATDAALLTPWHRRRLNAMIRLIGWPAWMGTSDASFVVAVLKAYEQVGDAKAIPVVTRLANYKARNERQRRIQQAAADCLPLLQARFSGVDRT